MSLRKQEKIATLVTTVFAGAVANVVTVVAMVIPAVVRVVATVIPVVSMVTFDGNVLNGESQNDGPNHAQGHLTVAVHDLCNGKNRENE